MPRNGTSMHTGRASWRSCGPAAAALRAAAAVNSARAPCMDAWSLALPHALLENVTHNTVHNTHRARIYKFLRMAPPS